MTTIWDTKNGVKPRFDGQGSEFGLMHRDLGKGFLMFDIDRLRATIQLEVNLRRENEAFVEYRHLGKTINFVALFEVKKFKTEYSLQAINTGYSSTLARVEMCKRLGCRDFVVFATEGKQPFEFYEGNFETGEYTLQGVLSYDETNREQKIKEFWSNSLGIGR